MALNHIRHEVVLALAQTKDLIREASAVLEKGEDAEKVDAAGELEFLGRQKAMLERRLREIDHHLAEPATAFRWVRQEWFNLMLHFESWIAHG
ncbi:MAG TPA: hypothetical protein VMU93_11715 [Caulobacteraceae bacterium]|nr:hypothetical protein [Caulobacteraceae bacterium]